MNTTDELKAILNKERKYSEKQLELIIAMLEQLLEIDIENFNNFCNNERNNLYPGFNGRSG